MIDKLQGSGVAAALPSARAKSIGPFQLLAGTGMPAAVRSIAWAVMEFTRPVLTALPKPTMRLTVPRAVCTGTTIGNGDDAV